MTTEPHSAVPQLTLRWRLKMALAHGNVTRAQMAEHLGYEQSTLSRWMSDKGTPPRKGAVLQWALLTEVPSDWLERGDGGTAPTPPGDGEPADDREAALARLASRKRARRAAGRPTDWYAAA